MSGLTVCCRVAALNTAITGDRRGVYNKLAKEITGEESFLGQDDLLGLQLYPDTNWPQKFVIKLATEELKRQVLVQGLSMFGITVFFQDDNSLFTKVIVKDVLLDWNQDMIKEMLEPYGDFIRAEPLKHIIDSRVTAWESGEWLAYMSKVHTVIPSVIDYKIELKSYRVRLWYEGQPQSTNAPSQSSNVISRQPPVIKNCGMCGASDHTTRECQLQVPVCFTCKAQDHTTRECPENEGAKVTEKSVIFYSSKCPLSNWNTEYPFSIGNTEYICIEQRVQAEKCSMFGDMIAAEKVMDETDPKKMRKLGENVRNYKHSEWMSSIGDITYEANLAKFSDRRAAGAKDYLLATGSRIIGEASANMKWGIGLKVSDRDSANPRAWKGENLSGVILMDIRNDIVRSQAPPPPPPPQNSGDTTDPPHTSSPTAPSGAARVSLGSVQEVDLNAALIGDHNTQNLSMPDDGHIKTTVFPFGEGASLTDIRQAIADGSSGVVQNQSVQVVALHVGASEWRNPAAGVTKAKDAYVSLVKLMNEISSKFDSPDLVVSSVPFLKLSDSPTPAEIQANEEIKKFNSKLQDLGEAESNVHFVDNSVGIYVDNKLVNLYSDPFTLNDLGRSILSDNLRNGIRGCFVDSLQNAQADGSVWQTAK